MTRFTYLSTVAAVAGLLCVPAVALAVEAAPTELVPAVEPQVELLAPAVTPVEAAAAAPAEADAVEAEVEVEAVAAEAQAEAEAKESADVQALLSADDSEFVAQAKEHCAAFLGGNGQASLLFALSKSTAAKFSIDERIEFNRLFARKVLTQYDVDPSKACVLDGVSLKQVRKLTHAPKVNDRYALPEPKHEIAVVSGALAPLNTNAPVSVAYRLERKGNSPWFITNISFNGQPLVDRYREEYAAVAEKGGSAALFDTLSLAKPL